MTEKCCYFKKLFVPLQRINGCPNKKLSEIGSIFCFFIFTLKPENCITHFYFNN